MSGTTAEDIRGAIKDDPESVYLMDHPDSDEEIPVLDMTPYLNGEPGGREKVAAHLREISMTVGFFYLKGHGIPQEVFDNVFAESRRFHALPAAEKNKLPYITTDSFSSGYQPGGQERRRSNSNIISDAKPNLYDKFSINREGGSAGADVEMTPQRLNPNAWPENLPGFRETVMDYHHRIERLARQFLPLWATSLKLPLDYFDKYFATPHLLMSLLYYPPQKEIGNRQLRHRAAHRQ
jgi:isopenicillin N synthase-like dioxygenase